MSAASNPTANEDETLAIPGVVCVTPMASGRKLVYAGPSAGWMVPRGIMAWEHELACIARSDAAALASTLKATQPHEQIAPKKFPMAKRAADVSPLLALSGSLAAEARERGLRVHTVGVDRVSAGFYYFGEGGPGAPVRAQGNLIEMLAPSLGASSTNAEIQALLDSLIDRLLRELSGGVLSELDVELADALPRFSRDGTGLVGTDIEAFDRKARRLGLESAHLDTAAREFVEGLAEATRRGLTSVAPIALYGEARRESRPELRVRLGDTTLKLPGQTFWTVTGAPRESVVDAGAAPPVPIVLEASPPPTPPRPKVAEPPAQPASPKPPSIDRPVSAPRPAAAAGSTTTPSPSPAKVVERSPRPAPTQRPEPTPAPTPVTALTPTPTRTPTPVTAPAPTPLAERAAALVPGVAHDREREPAVETPQPPAAVERTSAAPIPLVRPVRRGSSRPPEPVEKPAGTSMVAILLILVALAVAYFIIRLRHPG